MVVNVDWFFLSHRLPIALEAQKQGYKVTIVCANTGKSEEIKNHGLGFINLPLARGQAPIINEIKTFFFLCLLYHRNKPSIIHQVGLKIILIGSIAHGISCSKSKLINALSGAGTMFTSSTKKSNVFKLLLKIFKIFSKESSYYIFQNNDDLKLFQNFTKKIKNYSIIKGAGVDIEKFRYRKTVTSNPKEILFIGRLLKEKGVFELYEAAKLLSKEYYGRVKFIFLGSIDLYNPSSLDKMQIENLKIDNYIEFRGHLDNVIPFIEKSYLVVLPSYREGLPKSLIEACAVGKAIVTTEAIGCKEVVSDGINGYLVPVGDSKKLAARIKYLLDNESVIHKFGVQSRLKAENEFALSKVIAQTLAIYNLVIA